MLILAAGLLAAGPAAAQGAIVTFAPSLQDPLVGRVVVVEALDPTETNSLRVTLSVDSSDPLRRRRIVTVEETNPNGPTLVTVVPDVIGVGCANLSPRAVGCTPQGVPGAPGLGLAGVLDAVRVNLGARNDRIEFATLPSVAPQDLAALAVPFATVNGGIGDDRLVGASFAANRLDGEAGADAVSGGDGPDTLAGGLGRDLITGGAGPDNITGGADEDTIRAEDDAVQDTVSCGSPDSSGLFRGEDVAVLDLRDTNAGADCERVSRAPKDDHPTVRIAGETATLAGDALTARLACPAALRGPCAGRLTAVVPRARGRDLPLASTRYTVRAGSARRLTIALAAADLRTLGGRRTVRLRAVEPGSIGPKTTTALLRLARSR